MVITALAVNVVVPPNCCWLLRRGSPYRNQSQSEIEKDYFELWIMQSYYSRVQKLKKKKKLQKIITQFHDTIGLFKKHWSFYTLFKDSLLNVQQMFIISLKPLGLCRPSLQEAYTNIFIRLFGERKSLKCKIEQRSHNSRLQYVIYIVNANMRLFGSQFHNQVLQLYHCIKILNFLCN